ncbi:MAG: hypothetical protein NC111_07395 [Bacteroides sp.]|nr:hypothetical protein [Bacteroides sp.]MCM1414068.1 hypothetical protein [Bacteroides sp.]MCM1472333.1 hypothetical protein [Bacteroides sp.]
MKKVLLIIAVAAACSYTTGCNQRQHLAQEVSGSWATDQLTISNDAQGQSSGSDLITFTVSPTDKSGGSISIASTLSLTKSASALTPADAPFSMTIAATSSITGTWKATDDDEIIVKLDPQTLTINVDDDAVALVANPLSGATQSEIDSLKPQMAQFYRTELENTMRTHYSQYSRLDDIKTRDNGTLLKFEVNDVDMILKRSAQ